MIDKQGIETLKFTKETSLMTMFSLIESDPLPASQISLIALST